MAARLVMGVGLGLALCLTGCAAPAATGEAVLGANILAVASIHRTVPDAIYSWVTGRDCSLVRLDRGEPYCRTPEPLPPPVPYCTQTIGAVTCWRDPQNLPDHAPEVAQGPQSLSPAQLANRNRTWP